MLGTTLCAPAHRRGVQRVLGWILAAAVIAALLYPLVEFVLVRVPRGLAVVSSCWSPRRSAAVAATAWSTASSARPTISSGAMPRRAAELEDSKRFGEAAREFRLEERTRRFVKQVPARLRGGTPAEALRSAATRGVSYLATGVLASSSCSTDRSWLRGAAAQIHDTKRRHRVEEVASAVYHRGFGYARGAGAMAVLAGPLRLRAGPPRRRPGPAPLAVWVALWDLVPIVGASSARCRSSSWPASAPGPRRSCSRSASSRTRSSNNASATSRSSNGRCSWARSSLLPAGSRARVVRHRRGADGADAGVARRRAGSTSWRRTLRRPREPLPQRGPSDRSQPSRSACAGDTIRCCSPAAANASRCARCSSVSPARPSQPTRIDSVNSASGRPLAQAREHRRRLLRLHERAVPAVAPLARRGAARAPRRHRPRSGSGAPAWAAP